MSPNPLSAVKPSAIPYLPWSVLKERPEHAKVAMGIMTTWSKIESLSVTILCQFLESDYEITYAMYQKVESQELQRRMIDSAAEKALMRDPEALELYRGTMKALAGMRRLRNRLAHDLWMVCTDADLRDAICLVRAKGFADYSAQWAKAFKEGKIGATATPLVDKKEVYVYRLKELEREEDKAHGLFVLTINLTIVLNRDLDAPKRALSRSLLAARLSSLGIAPFANPQTPPQAPGESSPKEHPQ